MKLWIAKDDNGKICLYSDEPTWKVNGCWCPTPNSSYVEIPDDIDFPQEIELDID